MVNLSADKAWPLGLRTANKASKETIAKSLEGTWLPEQLAILKRQLVDQRRRSMARLIGGYHRSKHSPANSGIHRYPG